MAWPLTLFLCCGILIYAGISLLLILRNKEQGMAWFAAMFVVNPILFFLYGGLIFGHNNHWWEWTLALTITIAFTVLTIFLYRTLIKSTRKSKN